MNKIILNIRIDVFIGVDLFLLVVVVQSSETTEPDTLLSLQLFTTRSVSCRKCVCIFFCLDCGFAQIQICPVTPLALSVLIRRARQSTQSVGSQRPVASQLITTAAGCLCAWRSQLRLRVMFVRPLCRWAVTSCPRLLHHGIEQTHAASPLSQRVLL